MNVVIRRARTDEGARLEEIAVGAKGFWGLGAKRLEWEAEPNAIGFYEKMGGRYVRESEQTEWGRRLSVMGVELDG